MNDQVSKVIAEMEAQAELSLSAGGLAHELCIRIKEWAGRIEAATYEPATHPARGVVDEAMVERACAGAASVDGIDWSNPEWQAAHRIEVGRLRSRMRAALQAAALPADTVAMAIDPQLAAFYQVATVAELLAAQEEHIQKLQDSARRNVKPWEDTFPPTLLPKHLRDSGLTPTRNNMEQVRSEAFNLADTVIEWIESGNVQAARDAIRDSLVAHAALPAVPAFDMLAHLQRQREWSGRTFGPGPRTAGVIDHIRKELREIEADPTDLSEWIDVVILALDGAWRAGGTPEQIIAALVAKQTKNEGRTWPDWRTVSPDKAIEHDRTQDALPAVPEVPKDAPLTATALAEALSCFWNAAIGSQSVQYDPTARAVAGAMAEGLAAVEHRLRELAATPAHDQPEGSDND